MTMATALLEHPKSPNFMDTASFQYDLSSIDPYLQYTESPYGIPMNRESSIPLSDIYLFTISSSPQLVASARLQLVEHEQQSQRLLLLVVLHDRLPRTPIHSPRRWHLATHALQSELWGDVV